MSLLIPVAGVAERVSPADLDRLAPADVWVLGEAHGNPEHHANQARAVAALDPAALVFEMLTPAQAARAAPPRPEDAATLGAILDWSAGGWPDFELYHPIFVAAPEAAVFGGALARTEVRRVFSEPLVEVFGAGASDFGLDRDLDPRDQVAREAGQAAAHCDALPEAMLPGMVAAQRLRDAALARAVRAAHADTGGPVVLITGSAHARTDHGVPALLGMAAPDLSVRALGQFEAPIGTEDPPFDLWIVTGSPDRGDPCAVFRSAPPVAQDGGPSLDPD